MTRNTAHAEAGQELIERHTPTQRCVHWWTVCTMAAAVLTAPGGPRGHTLGLVVHITAVCALYVGLVLIVLLGDREVVRADLRELLRLDASDRAWLRSLTRPRAERREVRWGRYNTGQKLAAWGILTLVGALGLAGVFDAVLGRKTVHPTLILPLYVLLAGHVAMAVVNPATRPSLRGMIRGSVDRSWARRHHPVWVEQVEAASTPALPDSH